MPFTKFDSATASVIAGGPYGIPLVAADISNGKSFKEIQDELVLAIGDRDDVDIVRIKGWINESYGEMAAELDLDELRSSFSFSSVVDADVYKLPKGIWVVTDASVSDSVIYATGGRPLEVIQDDSVWRKMELATGPVTAVYQHRNLLAIWPKPTGIQTITLEFWVEPQVLVADTDYPLFEGRWSSSLIEKSRALAFSRLQMYDEAGIVQNEHVAKVRAKIDKKAVKKSGSVPGISVPRRRGDLFRRRFIQGEDE